MRQAQSGVLPDSGFAHLRVAAVAAFGATAIAAGLMLLRQRRARLNGD